MTRYKLEYLKMSMQLFDSKNLKEIKSDSELIDLLITRCALQEYFIEKKHSLQSYHNLCSDGIHLTVG
uniref:Uncharacterized protein n=1 Tax=Leptospira ellisii TaxID=2023197 RepID=A0A2N0BA73_9LEPT|nr:hypothetical protein CH379_07860 [Leptospira ellisii]